MGVVIWIALIVAYFWSVRNLARMGRSIDAPATSGMERPRVELIGSRAGQPATARSADTHRAAAGAALARRSS